MSITPLWKRPEGASHACQGWRGGDKAEGQLGVLFSRVAGKCYAKWMGWMEPGESSTTRGREVVLDKVLLWGSGICASVGRGC